MSPFVDDAKEGYVPKYKDAIENMKSAAERAAQGLPAEEESEDEGEDDEEEDDEEEEEKYAENVKNEMKGVTFSANKQKKRALQQEQEDEDEDEEDADEDEEDEDEEAEEQKAAEPTTRSAKKGPRAIAHAPKQEKKTEVTIRVHDCGCWILGAWL